MATRSFVAVVLCAAWYAAVVAGTDDKRFVVDTFIAHWGHWSVHAACSRTCGGGVRSRHRSCYYMGVHVLNAPCMLIGGAPTETGHCNSRACDSWSSWSRKGSCSVTCDVGRQTEIRHCSSGDDSDCHGSPTRAVSCHGGACPQVDGGWSDWTAWSGCPADCRNGTATRARSCTNPAPSNNGWDCNGDSTDTQDCSLTCATWSAWFPGPCSVTCGTGTMERLRRCSSGFEYDCVGLAIDRVACTKPPCV